MHTILRHIIFFTALAAAVLFPLLSHSAEHADIVLVMDGSGSMEKTDPGSLRVQAAKMFISLLDEGDRAGIISFSDRGYPVSYLTDIRGEDNREILLEAAENITSNGLYTNLYEAMNTGYEMLSRNTLPGRPQMIVLMSDGMMDTGDPALDRKLLKDLKSGLTGTLKEKNIKVYTIAFTDQSDSDLLAYISRQTGGFFNMTHSNREFYRMFTAIYESIKTPNMLPLTANTFQVDRSVEEFTVVASRNSPSASIQIRGPDGRTYSGTDHSPAVKWFSSAAFEMAAIHNPAEGKWEILHSGVQSNRAYITTHLNLRTNFSHMHSIYGEPLNVDIWIEKDGVPVTDDTFLETVDIRIELITPDGRTLKLKPFKAGKGRFVRNIAPFTAGNFRMNIIARGQTFERKQTFVFNVAGVKESRHVLAEKAKEKPPEQNPAPQKPSGAGHDAPGEVSWSSVLARFAAINLALFAVILVYIKRARLKQIKDICRLIKPDRLLPSLRFGKKADSQKIETRTEQQSGQGKPEPERSDNSSGEPKAAAEADSQEEPETTPDDAGVDKTPEEIEESPDRKAEAEENEKAGDAHVLQQEKAGEEREEAEIQH